MKMFPNKNWILSGVKTVLNKEDGTGSIERCSASGRMHMAHSPATISNTQDLVLSQEDKPKTHSSQQQIYR